MHCSNKNLHNIKKTYIIGTFKHEKYFYTLFIAKLKLFANNSYNIDLISQDNNSVLVEYKLNNYSLIDSKIINSIQHKKLLVEGGSPILNLGEPELLKFTSNIQLPETGVSNFTIVDLKILYN